MSTETPSGLHERLSNVALAINHVEKRGVNDHHGYSYTQAVDVIRLVREQLLAQRIHFSAATIPGSLKHFTETGGKSFVTTIDFEFTFTSLDDRNETITVAWAGAGADVGGDKGVYKAMTGALKYALIANFLLPMTDDPERDGLSQSPAPAAQHKDAERPTVMRIPMDRAKSIFDEAMKLGLASVDEEGKPAVGPVLKAKLALLGVDKVGALNVDQAEDVEAFLREESEAGATA